MIISSNSLSRGSGMPHQVDDAIVHAMSGTELSRVRTELRLLPPEPINQRLLASRGAYIVMQSSAPVLGGCLNRRSIPRVLTVMSFRKLAGYTFQTPDLAS